MTVFGPEQIIIGLLPASGLAAFVSVLPIAGIILLILALVTATNAGRMFEPQTRFSEESPGVIRSISVLRPRCLLASGRDPRMDFRLLPPEINSGRMYAGPGAAPMLAAAAGWDDLAAELHATVASYGSTMSGLATGWQGPSSATMMAAVAPYMAWLGGTATQAEQTATQARLAAASYETAFAATVPPPIIVANRALLMSLIATNLFGQNTAAIAATEAHYAEMWAQDAAAMYGYAVTSSAASQLTPFSAPPQTTNSDGAIGQGAAVARATATLAGASAHPSPALTSGVPHTVQSMASAVSAVAADPTADPTSSTTLLQLLSDGLGGFNPIRMYDPFGAFFNQGVQSFLAPFNNYNMQVAYAGALAKAASAAGGVGPVTHVLGSAGAEASADIGRAGLLGSLSVPQGWASAAPAIRPVAMVMPGINLGAVPAALAADGQGSVFGNMALSGMAGRAIAGTGTTVAPGIGAATNVVPGAAGTATIIVIPED